MTGSAQPQQSVSDGTIRRFLLAQLTRGEQSAFERALLMNPQLEQRTRLAEIALIDDCVLNRLKANERDVFQKEFLVTTARRRKLEVSKALRQTLAVENVSRPARSSSVQSLFVWPTLAWRIGFAIAVLTVLFASALVIRREPQIVKRIIPKRLRPATAPAATPVAAHHPVSVYSPEHSEEIPQLPAHEASPQTMILLANSPPDNAPIISLAHHASNAVRVELMLERNEAATFSAVVTSSTGEVVHEAPEISAQDKDRLHFDLPIERLKPGAFQISLKRLNGESSATYYFRVK
ncbi:MAG TPA: hypothetical protein VFX97_18460 [Pyrinomonadaceae bacterium]|nr:hypothetical protein [Pyrinomonadaceae bacterium]